MVEASDIASLKKTDVKVRRTLFGQGVYLCDDKNLFIDSIEKAAARIYLLSFLFVIAFGK